MAFKDYFTSPKKDYFTSLRKRKLNENDFSKSMSEDKKSKSKDKNKPKVKANRKVKLKIKKVESISKYKKKTEVNEDKCKDIAGNRVLRKCTVNGINKCIMLNGLSLMDQVKREELDSCWWDMMLKEDMLLSERADLMSKISKAILYS